jgi:hypothetical protein
MAKIGVMIACCALGAATVACSSSTPPAPSEASTKASAAPAETVTVTPPSTVTITAQPPITKTVTSPGSPPPTNVQPISGPFRSPSGNIRCHPFQIDGVNSVRCEAVEHTWVAPSRSPDCQLDFGDRLELEEGSVGMFSCYGQPLPDPKETLEYGRVTEFGSISCTSESVGIMCLDNDTGHYFNLSRESYQIG